MFAPHRRGIGLSLIAALAGAAPLSGQVGRELQLKVANGPNAGSYASTSEDGCNLGDDDEKEPVKVIVGFATVTQKYTQRGIKPNQLGQFGLMIPNIRSPKPGVLALGVIFGDLGEGGTKYEILTVPMNLRDEIDIAIDGDKPMTGRGNVKVDRRRTEATLTFWGETAEKVRFDGVIRCHRLSR
jgi:hypothetical protein